MPTTPPPIAPPPSVVLEAAPARTLPGLTEEENLRRLALEAAGIGSWRHVLATGAVFYDPLGMRHFGFDRPLGTLDELIDRVHPDYRAGVHDLMRQGLDPAGPGRVGGQQLILLPSGEHRWLDVQVLIVFEGEGARRHPVYAVSTSRDVTAVRQAEEALRTGQARFRDLVDSLDEVVFSLDPEGRITFINRAVSRFGYRPEQVIGRHRLDLIHPEDRERLLAIAGRGRPLPHHVPVEYRLLDASGAWRAVRSTTHPQLEGGRPVGVTGVLIDLSDQRAIEEQLRAAQKMEAVGRLAGGVAHDFNNLLTVILSYSEMSVEALHAGDPMRSDLQEVVEAARRAQALTSQLLAFSRRQVLNPERVDLCALVAGLSRMLGRLIGEDVELVVDGAPGQNLARVDRGQIEQVVMNLAVNARDAMPGGGRLAIRCGSVVLDGSQARAADLPAGRYVELAVADNGTGMDEDTRARIFEPFFTTKSAGKGTGLGLSTVYGIVKQSGGGITVDTAPGHGTTFRVLLPPAPSEPEGTVTPSRPPRPRRGRGETILVVEDDELMRELIQRVLGGAGYQLLVASDPQQALRLVAGHPGPIALLFTDVILPGMNGRELADRLAERTPGQRALFTSGYLDESLAQIGLAGLPFLPKPYDSRQLLAAISAALDA